MKKTLTLILVLSYYISLSQTKYLTKSGSINFEASVSSFEEVKAKNNNVTAIINTDNGEFAALVLVKGFRFKNALMEEHFNENYAESDTHPKATFKGKITDFDVSNLNKDYFISGLLTFHGVTKTIDNVTINIEFNNDILTLSGRFITTPEDYNIKIPNIVKDKVAKTVEVSFEFIMKKK